MFCYPKHQKNLMMNQCLSLHLINLGTVINEADALVLGPFSFSTPSSSTIVLQTSDEATYSCGETIDLSNFSSFILVLTCKHGFLTTLNQVLVFRPCSTTGFAGDTRTPRPRRGGFSSIQSTTKLSSTVCVSF